MHDNVGPPESYGILLGMNLLYICLTRAVLIGAVKTKLNKLTVSFFSLKEKQQTLFVVPSTHIWFPFPGTCSLQDGSLGQNHTNFLGWQVLFCALFLSLSNGVPLEVASEIFSLPFFLFKRQLQRQLNFRFFNFQPYFCYIKYFKLQEYLTGSVSLGCSLTFVKHETKRLTVTSFVQGTIDGYFCHQ